MALNDFPASRGGGNLSCKGTRERVTLILLIEDDEDGRENLAALLRSGGYEVATAANGREAHDWLAHCSVPPSLIFLDLTMPVMDGWHFRWKQVQDARLAQIPVVVLSAASDVRRVATALGAIAYLAKPLDPVSLLGALRYTCP
jgi:CheY-like chemotaxis protein